MRKCDNCNAEVPEGKGGISSDGRFICCVHCVFNPLGCRCKFKEYGVAEKGGPWMDNVGDDLDWQYDEWDADR